MGLLKAFRDSALEAITESAKEMKRMVDEFDFDKAEREVTNTIKEVVANLRKHIKNLTDKYVIEVAYDRNTQILTYTIDDNIITIVVKLDSEDPNIQSSSTTTVTIPENVNVNTMVQHYNADEKKMIFVFKKNTIEISDDEVELEVEVDGDIAEPSCEETNAEGTTSEVAEPNTDDIILEMYQNGASYRQIAKQVGLSDKTVARRIKKMTEGLL